MSHVGRHFDLRVGGRPLRIVVVGQESGWPKARGTAKFRRKVSLETRYHAVHDQSGHERRYYAQDGYPGRNPHMRGTTSALRVIFGKGLGSDNGGEFSRLTGAPAFPVVRADKGVPIKKRAADVPMQPGETPPGRWQVHLDRQIPTHAQRPYRRLAVWTVHDDKHS